MLVHSVMNQWDCWLFKGDRGGGGGLGEEGHVRGERQAVRPRRQAREGHRTPQQTPLAGQSPN